MSKAPSMPMYWDAYLSDTTHLSTEEHGAYMLLMAAMWRRDGSVPDSDSDNARILGLTKAKWRKVKVRLSPFLIIDGDTITQKKLQETWKNTQEKIQKNKVNGAKGGRAAASNINDLDEANATETLKPKSTIPEPEPEPIKREAKASTKKSPQKEREEIVSILSKSASPQASASYVAYRAKMKKALTVTAANRINNQLQLVLQAQYDPSDALGMCEENGWQGFQAQWYFNSKDKENDNRTNNSTNGQNKIGNARYDEALQRALKSAARRPERSDDIF